MVCILGSLHVPDNRWPPVIETLFVFIVSSGQEHSLSLHFHCVLSYWNALQNTSINQHRFQVLSCGHTHTSQQPCGPAPWHQQYDNRVSVKSLNSPFMSLCKYAYIVWPLRSCTLILPIRQQGVSEITKRTLTVIMQRRIHHMIPAVLHPDFTNTTTGCYWNN